MAKTSPLPSTERCDPLLERIVALFNVPPEARSELDRMHSFVRSRDVTGSEAFAILKSEFGVEHVSSCVDQTLDAVADMCLREDVPDRRGMFLTGCLLDLVNTSEEIQIRADTIGKVVQGFPVAIWYRPVGALVRRHLNRAELSTVLLDCIDNATSNFLRLSCLEAVGMYMPKAKAAVNPAAERQGLDAMRRRLTSLMEESDRDLKKAAGRAAEALRAIEAPRSDRV